MSNPYNVKVEGPLLPYVAAYRTYLQNAGYVPHTVSHQLQLLAHLSRWLAAESLGVGELTEQHLDDFFAERRRTHQNLITNQSLHGLWVLLTDCGLDVGQTPAEPGTNVDRMLGCFEHYLRTQRGLRQSTIENYLNQARPFMRWRAHRCEDFTSLQISEITEYLLVRGSEQSIGSLKVAATALRALLRWLHLRGITSQDLSTGIGPVAYSAFAALPKALPQSDVDRLLDASNLGGDAPLRDLAILLVLARLGLRANEVASLMFEDILWNAGQLQIHGKGGAIQLMPLPSDVGQALADYVLEERAPVKGEQHVFLTAHAPHHPLKNTGVSLIVARRGTAIGLRLPLGAHRLRHSAATRILAQGGTLTEAAILLRHADLSTTSIYAKVDRNALTPLAMPWPGGNTLDPACRTNETGRASS